MTPQPQQPRPSPQGQTPLSMNMNVSPEKRSALKNYLEGYKDAIQKKSMDQLLPNISTPQMPMQQPMQPPMMLQQPPMMMNMGGVVDVFEPQYMSNGGNVFTSNIKVKEGDTIGGRELKELKDERDRLMELDYGSPVSAFDRVLQGNIGYDEGALDEKLTLAAQNLKNTFNSFGGGPYDGGQFFDMPFKPKEDVSDDDLRMDEDEVESINPMYEDFKKSQESIFAPFVNKLGSFMGYDDPFDLYKATQATDAAYFEGQKDRKRDQDRAAAKLAEEQRMRDMIQGMLPPTTADSDPTQGGIGGMPTTPDPDAPETDTVEPDYSSVVVPSDRVPDFTIPELPSLPETSPLLPPGISPELIRNLLAMQGSSVTNMQEGGSVNKLDNAVDNFLNSLKG